MQDDDSVKDGRKDREKDGKKRKTKLYTYDPYLLLSFVYFDQTHCGYIFDKDIEELIYTLGLNLSRAQVRKLVQKVVTRDSLHYRKLTDKSKEDDLKDEKKDDREGDKSESAKTENEEDILRSLALGNAFLPTFFKLNKTSYNMRLSLIIPIYLQEIKNCYLYSWVADRHRKEHEERIVL